MILYGMDISNYYNIIKQALIEEKIDFNCEFAAPNQKPEFLAISPAGKIPAAKTDEGVLCETRAILAYIAAKHPTNTLFPKTPYIIAKDQELFSAVDLYVEQVARRLLPEVLFGAERNEQAYQEVLPLVENGMKIVGQLFEASPYIRGEFSIADIYLFHCLSLAQLLIQSVYQKDILDSIDGMAAWFDTMKQRPSTEKITTDQAMAVKKLRQG